MAVPLYVECLAKSNLILREAHPDTLVSMNNLALFYKNQGQFIKAEPLLVKCLAKRKKLLGKDHPDTLVSMVLLFY